IGINEALGKLPAEYLKTVQVTSLSTTLATNAIVEGRGSKVGTILYSPFERFAEDAGLSPCLQVKGALDISGAVLEDIDPDEVLAAAEMLVQKEKCMALCVGGYASLRNPELSMKIKALIRDKYPDLCVICSHDISQKLNAVNSLKTAAANARLIPVIGSLIHSVRKALESYGVGGRLMIVKGDGTCVNTDAALERPIETVLSGPASSVSGARLLTGIKDAIVADVGGTTTDIAVLKDGLVDISLNGALVGGSVMQINAVSINTSGLGGDSRISFSRDRHITVGPVRNVPVCVVAAEYPSVADKLKDMSGRSFQTAQDTSLLDVLLYSPFCERLSLSVDESRLCRVLKEKGAMFASDAREELGLASNELLHLPALEAAGAIRRCHLTPTDIFHIQGKMNRWDTGSAVNALSVFAMLLGTDTEDLTERIWRQIRYMLLSQLLQRELTDETGRECSLSGEAEYMLRGITDERKGGVAFSLSLPHPLIAIGAPVKDMFDGFGKYVNTEVVIPEHADVANAVGAVSGEIIARETVYIRPGNETGYVVYSSQKRIEENTLSGATATGLELCKELARAKSLAAGALDPLVRVTVKDRISHTADGGLLFVERLLTGQGAGASIEAKQ
ncbi:MAG: hydantoinase/oxoprolinase family protein, partial [Abditibacteriota bacterium]|nr:hydantoinase/oxoprolinase family protein [Abditibacteriota bacterium]